MVFETDSIRDDDDQPGRERRLHMLAYDYWHLLRGDRPMPDFRDLTPDGLAPFRDNSLLVDFGALDSDGKSEPSVRFAGGGLAELLANEPVRPGMAVASLATTDFGAALLDFLAAPESRLEATEFDYSDDSFAGRGVLLPLALKAGEPAFIWVVTSFDVTGKAAQREQHAATRQPADSISADDASSPVEAQLAAARALAAEAPHMDGGGRHALYQALAAALRLYETAADNSENYRALLAEAGIKPQRRAPYTPALKLVFGKDYDKTRLTEYAAALTHAVRHDITSAGLVTFLEQMQGGIKGCVLAERAIRRGDDSTGSVGDSTAAPGAVDRAADALLQGPARAHIAGDDLRDGLEGDIGLVLARRSGDGIDILHPVKAGAADLHRLIRQRR